MIKKRGKENVTKHPEYRKWVLRNRKSIKRPVLMFSAQRQSLILVTCE